MNVFLSRKMVLPHINKLLAVCCSNETFVEFLKDSIRLFTFQGSRFLEVDLTGKAKLVRSDEDAFIFRDQLVYIQSVAI